MRPTPTYEEFEKFLIEFFNSNDVTREDISTGIEGEGRQYDLSEGIQDSVLQMNMVMEVEEKYSITIGVADITEMRTVEGFYQVVCEASPH